MADLERLGELRDRGLLTEEQFEAAREELFERRSSSAEPANSADPAKEVDLNDRSGAKPRQGSEEGSWWQASDGKWYPQESRSTIEGQGWWSAADGLWYPPIDQLLAGKLLVTTKQAQSIRELLLPSEKLLHAQHGFILEWNFDPGTASGSEWAIPYLQHGWIAVTTHHLRLGQFHTRPQAFSKEVWKEWKRNCTPEFRSDLMSEPVDLESTIFSHTQHPLLDVSGVTHSSLAGEFSHYVDHERTVYRWEAILSQLGIQHGFNNNWPTNKSRGSVVLEYTQWNAGGQLGTLYTHKEGFADFVSCFSQAQAHARDNYDALRFGGSTSASRLIPPPHARGEQHPPPPPGVRGRDSQSEPAGGTDTRQDSAEPPATAASEVPLTSSGTAPVETQRDDIETAVPISPIESSGSGSPNPETLPTVIEDDAGTVERVAPAEELPQDFALAGNERDQPEEAGTPADSSLPPASDISAPFDTPDAAAVDRPITDSATETDHVSSDTADEPTSISRDDASDSPCPEPGSDTQPSVTGLEDQPVPSSVGEESDTPEERAIHEESAVQNAESVNEAEEPVNEASVPPAVENSHTEDHETFQGDEHEHAADALNTKQDQAPEVAPTTADQRLPAGPYWILVAVLAIALALALGLVAGLLVSGARSEPVSGDAVGEPNPGADIAVAVDAEPATSTPQDPFVEPASTVPSPPEVLTTRGSEEGQTLDRDTEDDADSTRTIADAPLTEPIPPTSEEVTTPDGGEATAVSGEAPAPAATEPLETEDDAPFSPSLPWIVQSASGSDQRSTVVRHFNVEASQQGSCVSNRSDVTVTDSDGVSKVEMLLIYLEGQIPSGAPDTRCASQAFELISGTEQSGTWRVEFHVSPAPRCTRFMQVLKITDTAGNTTIHNIGNFLFGGADPPSTCNPEDRY